MEEEIKLAQVYCEACSYKESDNCKGLLKCMTANLVYTITQLNEQLSKNECSENRILELENKNEELRLRILSIEEQLRTMKRRKNDAEAKLKVQEAKNGKLYKEINKLSE